ncbi:DUF3306 domain-containing protein [Halomonas sp. 328]|uniref:DUF3306 domain-containing protein n=1 Tax=Halomonas sp. 328 TaxID=2776704 RepID=UPI0018A6DFEE|nr:DUF3306 domain-containing protein [Halomonas sp. 328]MBF8221594.1 DUF3306 domain-containing protein [Halomonas sp. 328]
MSRLSRWSERKREAAQAEGSPAPPPIDEAADAPAAASAADSGEAAPLPDPDDLAPGSEISAFMASGVGEALRRRALRRLFAGDQYGVRDGLDDYDDDYRRLQPLAGELAERLRRWTRPSGEAPQDDNLSGEAVDHAAPGEDEGHSTPASSADEPTGEKLEPHTTPAAKTLDQG